MDIYILHTITEKGTDIPSCQFSKEENAEAFARQIDYLTADGCTVERETFDRPETLNVDLGDGGEPLILPNNNPAIIERATIRDEFGTRATVETYLCKTPHQ